MEKWQKFLNNTALLASTAIITSIINNSNNMLSVKVKGHANINALPIFFLWIFFFQHALSHLSRFFYLQLFLSNILLLFFNNKWESFSLSSSRLSSVLKHLQMHLFKANDTVKSLNHNNFIVIIKDLANTAAKRKNWPWEMFLLSFFSRIISTYFCALKASNSPQM